jgi:hypothetical protein
MPVLTQIRCIAPEAWSSGHRGSLSCRRSWVQAQPGCMLVRFQVFLHCNAVVFVLICVITFVCGYWSKVNCKQSFFLKISYNNFVSFCSHICMCIDKERITQQKSVLGEGLFWWIKCPQHSENRFTAMATWPVYLNKVEINMDLGLGAWRGGGVASQNDVTMTCRKTGLLLDGIWDVGENQTVSERKHPLCKFAEFTTFLFFSI